MKELFDSYSKIGKISKNGKLDIPEKMKSTFERIKGLQI
jgi:hypothetical protein